MCRHNRACLSFYYRQRPQTRNLGGQPGLYNRFDNVRNVFVRVRHFLCETAFACGSDYNAFIAKAKAFAKAPDYPETARAALKEMHRQTGDLEIDDRGLARRGLLVRHLVLPDGQSGTREIMRFLVREISPDTYVNLMGQYHPAGRSENHPEIHRRITPREFQEALRIAKEEGIWRLDRE